MTIPLEFLKFYQKPGTLFNLIGLVNKSDVKSKVMKANHKNLAAKANLVYNLYLDTDTQRIGDLKQEINPIRGNYEFQDFSFDYKKINELKSLRAKKIKS